MKKLALILIIVIMSMLLTVSVGLGCYELINAANSPEALFVREMGTAIKSADIKTLIDTGANSPFGDGYALYEIAVDEDSFDGEMLNALPLSGEALDALEAFLTMLNNEERAVFSQLFAERGAWRFVDRSPEKKQGFFRNYSLCVYDEQNGKLWYFRFDS